jgi:hypothetical protein
MKILAGLFLFAAIAHAQTTTVTGILTGTLTVQGTGVTGSMPVSGTVAVTYPTGTASPPATATVTGTLSGALGVSGTDISGNMPVSGTVTITYPTGTTPPPPPPPPGTCAPFTDPFSGALGAALNSANWTQPAGFSIGGGSVVQDLGVAQANAKYRGGGAILTSCPASLTPSIQFTVAAVDGLGAIQGLLSTTAAGNGYSVSLNNSGDNQQVTKCTAGVCKSIGTAVCSAGFTATSVFRASAVIVAEKSIAISVYRNGVLCGTVTDSSSPYTTGYSGFVIDANGSALPATRFLNLNW